MADDLLSRLDKSVTASQGRARYSGVLKMPSTVRSVEMVEEAPPKAQAERQWDLVLFLMAQFLWGALLFIPGSQAYRAVIRALPYVVSVGLLAVYLPRVMKSRSPRGTLPLLLALGLIVMNLLHPSTSLNSGIAQCVFQAAIAAPMFWGWRAIRNVDTLRRLLWITFAFNLVGSVLGVLQVYYPDRFMPPQFSTLGTKMNEFYVESLTYMGPDGQLIVRPPGLSDQPGGAAVSGALTVVLGAGLSLAARTPAGRWATLAAVGIGLAAIYLTQVRSLLLMSIAALGVLALVLFRRGQARIASRVAITAGVLVIGSFLWARSLGGQAVEDRFASITQQGTMRTYQENRGGFVNETFGELLDQYPLGAGVGRWGMMQVYFGDLEKDLPPIHVEIQITGWLLDGGIPMWVLYGGAIVLALLTAYTLSLSRASPALRDVALIVLSVEVLIVGFSWAGPAFNTQLGILFWFLASALYGASREMKSPVLAHRA